MLFNSYVFIFLFLPAAVGGFFLAGRFSTVAASLWLGAASLFFYGYWEWSNVYLLAASILFNYFSGRWMAALVAAGDSGRVRVVLWGSVATNLVCLGYYKYSNFFVASLVDASGMQIPWVSVILPLGISFFTFTQIAFLVDVARGRAREPRFDHYLLFVTYFPHLIAGPILHHAEVMPQFARAATYLPRAEAFAVGTTVFIIGLFKKVVIADSLGPYADSLFAAAPAHAPTLLEAWGGVLCYTFQIYFDFSAYMDMAIGISMILNIRLPVNFDSPYKALSIIEFWRRWHMTLSRFLRDYLYVPLGGNRKGPMRRHVNLMATMLLGGLWHGAGWTFIIWGCLHGFYLVINHGWRFLSGRFRHRVPDFPAVGMVFSWAITFVAVSVAWVFFRAPDVATAFSVLKGMAGMNGAFLPLAWLPPLAPLGPILTGVGIQFGSTPILFAPEQVVWLLVAFCIAVLMPNVREFMRGHELTLPTEREQRRGQGGGQPAAILSWRPSVAAAGVLVFCFLISLATMTKVSQFLYFQF